MFYTNDPIADFQAYDREQAEWLASRPMCDLCGERIQDDHYYMLPNKNVCPNCLDRFYRTEIED